MSIRKSIRQITKNLTESISYEARRLAEGKTNLSTAKSMVSELRVELQSVEKRVDQAWKRGFCSRAERAQAEIAWYILREAAISIAEIEYALRLQTPEGLDYAWTKLQRDFEQEAGTGEKYGLPENWRTTYRK